MVTTPDQPEAPSTTKEDILDAAYMTRDTIARGARTLLTGDAHGRMRRNFLFALAGLGYVVPALGVVGLIALLLLALTDMVIIDG